MRFSELISTIKPTVLAWIDSRISQVGGGIGDMLKSIYDTNGDGVVDAADSADNASYANTAGDADTVDGYHAADLKAVVSTTEPVLLYAGRVWVDIS